MEALPLISGIFSIVGGMSSSSSLNDAAAEEQRMGELNAKNIALEAEREKFVAKEQFTEEEALNRAKIAASGTTGAGSQDIFLGAQKDKFKSQLDWLQKSSKSRQELAKKQGNIQSSITRNQAKTAKYSGFQNALTSWAGMI